MTNHKEHYSLKTVLAGLFVYLLLLAFVYSMAWSGGLHFDDAPNLGSLAQIENPLDALDFISGGSSGPLGRPVALATFAFQYESWPDPRPFLIVNTFIHLLNVIVVFLLALALARFGSNDQKRNAWFAFAVAVVWSSSPFLASSSLMIVQRMTTLAGLFVFLGLLGYTHGRWLMRSRPRAGTYLAIGSIVSCTFFGVLTKENAALLPILALAIELTIIRRSQFSVPKLDTAFGTLLLGGLTLSILGYLGYRGITGSGYQGRAFDLSERLLSQARALWDYVFNLLAPNAAASSPYTDDFAISIGFTYPATTIPALLGLMAIILLAWFARKNWPFVTFGVAFFLGGHLLESTTIPLELYFPHRNYVPAFGLYFAILYGAIMATRRPSTRRLGVAGTAGYTLIALFVLSSTTSLWGKPEVAGLIWFAETPDSMRARQDLAGLYLVQGNAGGALTLINEGLEEHPRHPVLALQRLIFCVEDAGMSQEFVTEARDALQRQIPLPFGAVEQLGSLAANTGEQGCSLVTPELFEELLALGFRNLEQFPSIGNRISLLNAKAQFYANQGDLQSVRAVLEEILGIEHRVEVVRIIADTHLHEGHADRAREVLSRAKDLTHGHWFRRSLDRARLARWIDNLADSGQVEADRYGD